MKYLFIVFLAISFQGLTQSSDCDRSVTGRVLDIDTNEPLPFATVKIKNSSLGAVADESGAFEIKNICQDEVDLEVRFLGYKTVVHHHDFHHPSPVIYMASEETLLESVVVEEVLNAHEVKTLDPKEISIEVSESMGATAGDLLAKASGVYTLRTGQNVVKPVVHGLHSNRVLIINNGVRHSYQAWGSEHAPEIDPSQIDRIQLIKGASTVRYGPDALGGVILFDAPQPAYNSELQGEINTGFQTNGRSFSAEATAQSGYERNAWMVSVNGTKQGDLKAPDYHLTNTGKRELGYSIATRHHFSWIDIDLYASHFEQELGILRGSVNGNLTDLANAIGADVPNETKDFSYDINNPRQETVHDLFKIKTAIFLGEQQFDLQYAFQKNERREFDIRRGTNNDRPAINLKLNTHTVDFDWDHPSSGNWAGTVGLQFFTQNNDNIPGTNTIPFVPNYNNTSIGLFGIESYSTNRTTYEAGLRFDFLNMNVRGRDSSNDIYRDDLNFQNFTFTAGVIHDFSDQISIRSNIGTAWRAPNINELYSFGKHQNIIEFGLWRYEIFIANDSISTSGVLTQDDKEVKSERGIKWISTLDIHGDAFRVEITPYANWIQNYFFLRPYGLTNTVRGTFPYFIHDQTDAFYAGLDVDISKEWTDAFSGELKVSYVYARDISNDQPFIGIPPLNVQASLTRKIKNVTLTLYPSWTARQTHQPTVIPAEAFAGSEEILFDRTGTFDFLTSPEAFFLINASLKYERDNLTARIAGENLLNTSYRRYTDQSRYFADDLGINFKLFLSYSF
ncbi:TonB-dependent receptor [Ekhidna sp.]|jgi:iron complex outermembrane receptor protein|uniref:TonB-dependent receptor n=1 Tax=Ekhidna sp. TaxID=2608089 RepID=UPI0032EB13F0